MVNTKDELASQKRAVIESQAKDLGYNLNYEPIVQMDDIRLLPQSYWHTSRQAGWGGSDEGVLNNISKYKSLLQVTNEKLFGDKQEITAEKQFCFDFGHALEWVMLKYYAAVNGYKFLTYTNYFVLVKTIEDVSLKDTRFKKAMKGLYSFVTQNEQQAQSVLAEISKMYPNAYIEQEETNEPKDIREITQSEHDHYDSQGIVCVDRRQYINPNYTSMLGDMDGVAITPDGNKRGIECKTYTHTAPKGSFTNGVLGTDGMVKDDAYYLQVVHYMAVCNIDRFDIVATCGNTTSDFTITTVYRDVALEKALCENNQQAWDKYVVNLEPVEVTSLPLEAEKNLIRSLTPVDQPLSEETIDVPEELLSNVVEMEKIDEKVKFKQAEIDTLMEQKRVLSVPFEEILASNTNGMMRLTGQEYNYKFELKPFAGRCGFNQKGLQAEYPEVYAKYRTAAKQGDRKLKVYKTKKGNNNA